MCQQTQTITKQKNDFLTPFPTYTQSFYPHIHSSVCKFMQGPVIIHGKTIAGYTKDWEFLRFSKVFVNHKKIKIF